MKNLGLLCAIKIFFKKHNCPIPKIGTQNTLYICGNGPSLKSVYDNNIRFFHDKKVLCVNRIAETSYYEKIKPLVYVMIDGIALGTDHNMTEQQKKIAEGIRKNIVKKTMWDMYLVLPYAAKNSELVKAVSRNKNVHLVFMNTNVYGGCNKKIKYFMWKKEWCAPRMENVLVASIFIGLLMNFKKIYLYGADHDWIKTISVNEENQIATDEKHVYEEKCTENKHRINNENRYMRLGDLLSEWACMWNTYYELNNFAKANNIDIINATPNSYIDAFPRCNIWKFEQISVT